MYDTRLFRTFPIRVFCCARVPSSNPFQVIVIAPIGLFLAQDPSLRWLVVRLSHLVFELVQYLANFTIDLVQYVRNFIIDPDESLGNLMDLVKYVGNFIMDLVKVRVSLPLLLF